MNILSRYGKPTKRGITEYCFQIRASSHFIKVRAIQKLVKKSTFGSTAIFTVHGEPKSRCIPKLCDKSRVE
eukprot:251599-Ditylum_brightwellii.AAC.1